MDKECSGCPGLKSLGMFHRYKTGTKAGTYRAICILCTRAQNTAWYHANKRRAQVRTDEQKRRTAEVKKRWRNLHPAEVAEAATVRRRIGWVAERAWRQIRIEDFRNRLKEIKKRPCADCGVEYPHFVMEFDHRDPLTKKFAIGAALSGTRSWKSIEAEIAKCDLVCANCHRIRTAKSLSWGV